MSKLDEMLIQEKLEKRVTELVGYIIKTDKNINGMMDMKLVECSAEAGTITIEFPVLDWQLNNNNVMHGGIIATAFDEALGTFAHYFSEDKTTVTSNITVHYLKPVPMNDSLLITAKVISLGRKLITLSGEGCLKSNGIVTNSAIATFVIVG